MISDVKTININQTFLLGIISLLVLLGLLFKPGGIGGTGIGDDDGNGNGGIGGTGIRTGFVGRIDGFGSIWVNGSEIFYDKEIPVNFNGRTGVSSELKIGHVVKLIATPDSNNVLQATRLNVRYEVIGEVKSLNQNTVTILTDTVIFSQVEAGMPDIGDIVGISGFRRNDNIVMASRFDILPVNHAGKANELLQPFVGQVETLSLSGYARRELDGYSLYGYRINDVPDNFSLDTPVKITAKTGSNSLLDVTVEQVIVPVISPSPMPEPEVTPQDVPEKKRLRTPNLEPKQETPDKLNKASPIIPQPIRGEMPAKERPERQNSLTVPVQRIDVQSATRPSDEPENQALNALPKQQEVVDLSVPDEEIVEQTREEAEQEIDTELSEQSSGELDVAEQSAEPDVPEPEVPERDVFTPERETRPDRPNRTERIEKPERIEQPDRPDRPEKVERPERPERPR